MSEMGRSTGLSNRSPKWSYREKDAALLLRNMSSGSLYPGHLPLHLRHPGRVKSHYALVNDIACAELQWDHTLTRFALHVWQAGLGLPVFGMLSQVLAIVLLPTYSQVEKPTF